MMREASEGSAYSIENGYWRNACVYESGFDIISGGGVAGEEWLGEGEHISCNK